MSAPLKIYKIHRVLANTIDDDFKMQMVAGGVACGAYKAYYRSPVNVLTNLAVGSPHMGVQRLVTILMVYYNTVAITSAPSRINNNTSSCWFYWGSACA